MQHILNVIEVRILGSLMEKEKTTPEYYPLTLNALTRACNQKNNRNPVVSFDEKTVAATLDTLGFHKDLTKRILSDDSRVPKYRHDLTKTLNLTDAELAALCVLMLRGPQTLGEIRGRTERLHPFESLEEVEQTLQALITREPPLATQLPRQMGRKEARFAHLLSGEVETEEPDITEPAVLEIRADNQRMDQLEGEVQSLKGELQDLKDQFTAFKQQFE
ncbi:MAG: YceH family protein [bacterium]|nr:YceH family protein [bacterium]